MRLVADIGGTNARVALCAKGVIDDTSIERYSNADWDSLDDLLRAYRGAQRGAGIDEMVIAVAGPVHAGRARLTNRNWTINADAMKQDFACKRVVLLNDLGALGHAVPVFGADHVTQVCGGDLPREPDGQALVVGIGTGFNISQVICKDGATVCPPAEAGHVSMPSAILAELVEHGCNPALFPTIETLFSGRGLTAFCRAVTGAGRLTGEMAVQAYATDGAPNTKAAIDLYARLLGLLLREFSLSYMPTQGIFLAGSVARAIVGCASDPLVTVLKMPCRFRADSTPALYVIEQDGAALLGSARY
ncbi:glucokinase [Pseudooctadecabacter jejudonensis]|uniref:Glucokinase n=1 Tax=Pseudooctadecabacter jejudonensis TaxID=1391910 RepID=A0A1Y5R7I8_9RHOB|nr:glucokinase [Pseudooctadecabacter jejudonensis]SLN10647.1 Glucokinase [Pseudooctadecabacter jejudonensis]